MPIDLPASLPENGGDGSRSASAREDRSQMQRVQIGITGLAVVFLVVLLAAALGSFRSDSTGSNNAMDIASNKIDEPKDPLAELGVAPGGATSASSESRVPTH